MGSSTGGVAVLHASPPAPRPGTQLRSGPLVAGFERTDLLTAVREKIMQTGFV